MPLRPVRDADAPGLIALVKACWSEYPGVIFDLHGESPELLALAAYFDHLRGAAWVVEQGGRIAGCIGVAPHADGAWRITKMYVDIGLRGGGVAARLLSTAEAHAIAKGAQRLVLWSDTKFTRAHRFYEKHAYVRHGPLLALHDKSGTIEFGYAKPVNGVQALDAAAVASAARGLAAILIACVDDGASVSFLPPLARQVAETFWREAASEAAMGRRQVLGAWSGARLAGCVTLGFAPQPNQAHRADVQKLLVHPAARRQGLARALLRAAEAEALRHGRWLLTLDTKTGDAAETLYRTLGYTEVGQIPDHSANADGTLSATTVFYKRLARA